MQDSLCSNDEGGPMGNVYESMETEELDRTIAELE